MIVFKRFCCYIVYIVETPLKTFTIIDSFVEIFGLGRIILHIMQTVFINYIYVFIRLSVFLTTSPYNDIFLFEGSCHFKAI